MRPGAADAAAPGSLEAWLAAVVTGAGRVALGHFRRVTPERKADRTLVTQADRDVEGYLTAALERDHPAAGILGEEGTLRPPRDGRWFVIDPIDGTAAFVAGLPTWCICLGQVEGDALTAGAVYLPCVGELYLAGGGVATCDGVPLAALGADPPAGDAFVAVHSKAHRRHPLGRLGKVRSLGSAAYHIVLVARGVAEVALLGDVALWDLAAAGAILGAVGGRFELLDGRPLAVSTLLDGRRPPGDVVAGTASAIARLRARLAS